MAEDSTRKNIYVTTIGHNDDGDKWYLAATQAVTGTESEPIAVLYVFRCDEDGMADGAYDDFLDHLLKISRDRTKYIIQNK